jgi:hypothetical protein
MTSRRLFPDPVSEELFTRIISFPTWIKHPSGNLAGIRESARFVGS